jgi:hypothetical protein
MSHRSAPQALADAIAALLEKPDDAERRRVFSESLEANPEFVADYVGQVRVHAMLQWALSKNSVSDLSSPSPAELLAAEISPLLSDRSGRRRRRGLLWAVAASIAVVAGATFYMTSSPELGTVVAATNVTLTDQSRELAPGEPFRAGVIEATQGSCSLRFKSGVELLCDGAFRLRIVDGMLVELEEGKIRANVPPVARGFSVDTPDTFLVDQGTEFGVDAEAANGTQVVVFKGEVDVSTKHAAAGDATRRLIQGEGAQLLSGRAQLDRVSQVVSDPVPAKWSARADGDSLVSVRDNIRSTDSLKYYNIVVDGLQEDALACVDRPHQWNGIDAAGIPKIVRGAEYVQVFNDDRYKQSYELHVTVKKPATLYLMIDDRVKQLPEWLTHNFEDTREDIGLDEGRSPLFDRTTAEGSGRSIDHRFSIWKREFENPGEIVLRNLTRRSVHGMYGIAAVSIEE